MRGHGLRKPGERFVTWQGRQLHSITPFVVAGAPDAAGALPVKRPHDKAVSETCVAFAAHPSCAEYVTVMFTPFEGAKSGMFISVPVYE
jgi:hypothetical protein